MNKINLIFLLVQVTLISNVTAQKPMCSRKVVFVDGTYNASSYDALLFFDLAMASKDELRFYISTESNKGLEIWTFDLRQELQKNQSLNEVSGYRKYWVLKQTVSMDLKNPFSAFIINGKDYIINESGEFYSLERVREFYTVTGAIRFKIMVRLAKMIHVSEDNVEYS